VDEGVTSEQLENVAKTYVSEVYESDGQDLYNVLLYQYSVVLQYLYSVLLYQLVKKSYHVVRVCTVTVQLQQYMLLYVYHVLLYVHCVLMYEYIVLLYQYRHVQHDWSSSRADRDSAAVRGLLMQLLADGHQVHLLTTLLAHYHRHHRRGNAFTVGEAKWRKTIKSIKFKL